MQLTILHFNDLHGRLDQCPRLFTLIQRASAEARAAGRRVLLLDGGDSSDRAVWESDITKGRANFVLLEAMGVQASVVGNGEALHWGRRALERLVGSVHFPVLAANLVDIADPSRLAVPNLGPSHLMNVDGLPVGLVGVTARYPGGYDRFGYTAVDPLPPLRREVDALRAGGARLIILLSHLGYATPEEKETWADPEAVTDDQAVAACPEIGVVIGGHSHSALQAPVAAGRTLIAQAGDYGRFLGQLDLTIDRDTGQVLDHSYTLHATEGAAPDPTISATLDFVREEAGRMLDTAVGEAAVDLPHRLDRPSPFAARVAEALRDVCRADLAIFFGGFAHEGLAAGPVTRRDLYRALPGSTHVTAAEVTGAQIGRMIERMLASPYRTESFSPHRGEPPLGLPACSANVELDYDLAREPGRRLVACRIDGGALDPARRYRLASTYFTLNDLTGDPGYDFIGLQPGQVVEVLRVEDVLWEIVEDWLKARGRLD